MNTKFIMCFYPYLAFDFIWRALSYEQLYHLLFPSPLVPVLIYFFYFVCI